MFNDVLITTIVLFITFYSNLHLFELNFKNEVMLQNYTILHGFT